MDELDSLAFAALESNGTETQNLAQELLTLSTANESFTHQINAHTILGILNKNKGHYASAIDNYNDALKVAEQAGDQARASACLNNIGSVYQIQEDYKKALSYYRRSLQIESTLDNPLQKSIRFYNVGQMYSAMDSLTLALSNFNSSLLIEKEYGNKEGVNYALLGIADVYIRLDRLIDAELSLNEVANQLSSYDVEINILYLLTKSKLLVKKGDFNSAKSTLEKAIHVSEKNNYKVHILELFELEKEIDRLQSQSDQTPNYSGILIIGGLVLMLLTVLALIYYRKRLNRPSEGKNQLNEQQDSGILSIDGGAGKDSLQFKYDDIWCVEGYDNYVNLYAISSNNQIEKSIHRTTLRQIEKETGGKISPLLRVHKSYIVNADKIDSISGKAQAYRIHLKHLDLSIPVSRNFDISRLKS